MKFEKSNPILFSKDIKRSLQYYTEILGFEHYWEWGEPANFGGVSKDNVEIFFCLNGQGHPGTWIALLVENVDEYYDEIIQRGATVHGTPVSQEWNMREIYVEDPDGHILRIGHRIDCE